MESLKQWVFELRRSPSSFATNYKWRSVFITLQIGSFVLTKAFIENRYYNVVLNKLYGSKKIEKVNDKKMKLLLLCSAIRTTRQIMWCFKFLRYDLPASMALFWPFMAGMLDICGITLAAKGKDTEKLNLVDKIGFVMFMLGSIMESGHDFLLNRFKCNPENKGKLYKEGFANYIVHPNYSGFTFWRTGLAMMSQNLWFTASVSTLFGLNFALVSGPELREFCSERYGDKYIDYVNKTYKLIPFVH